MKQKLLTKILSFPLLLQVREAVMYLFKPKRILAVFTHTISVNLPAMGSKQDRNAAVLGGSEGWHAQGIVVTSRRSNAYSQSPDRRGLLASAWGG